MRLLSGLEVQDRGHAWSQQAEGQAMTLAEALARLAAVPPKLFTRERRSLVEAMRAAGDSKTARVVQARRAPTIPVWVANRLAREHAKSLDDLIAAANHLKAAQLGRHKGSGDLAQVTAAYRASLDRFLDHGRAIVEEAGFTNVEQILSRVERTVTAALVDATARAALQRGQLESELASPGFDVFGGAHPVESRRRRGRVPVTPTRPTAARRAHVPALREAREERRRRRLEPLETAVQKVQEQLAAAQAQVPEAETRLASLLGDVRQAREDLKRRRAEGRKLEQAVRRARRVLDAARQRKE